MSYGTNVAGAAIEAAAGQRYFDFVKAAVLAPLELVNTSLDDPLAADPQRVSFYEVRDGQYKLADRVDNSIRYPSGGMLSTPSEMVVLGNAFMLGSLLSQQTRMILLTPQALDYGSMNEQGYALGIRVSHDKALDGGRIKTTIYSHHGIAVGSTSYFAMYPQYLLSISLMMNQGQSNIDALRPTGDRLVEWFVSELDRQRKSADQAAVSAEG